MLNHIPATKCLRLFELFLTPGMTVRLAARLAGCAKQTASSYRASLAALPECQCGQAAGHRGWCSFRFANSPKRQALKILRYRRVAARCSVRACSFPAVMGDLCRAHQQDKRATFSPIGSSCLPAIQEAHLLYLGDK